MKKMINHDKGAFSMKKKFFRIFATVVSAVMLSALLTGCNKDTSSAGTGDGASGGDESGNLNIAVILGNHDNAYVQDLGLAEDYIRRLYDEGGRLVSVISDGNPEDNLKTGNIKQVDTSLSESNRKQKIAEGTQKMIEDLKKQRAKSEEVALLDAISIASKNMEQNGEHIMLILDTGFSTAGKLDMTTIPGGFSNLDTENVLTGFESNNTIPDVNGYQIIWYGLNQPTGDQTKATETDELRLKELWKKILEAGGASVQFESFSVKHDEWSDSLPKVTPISLEEDDSPWPEEIEVKVDENGKPVIDKINFTEEKFAFKKNLADFEDKALAEKNMEEFVSALADENITSIVLVGCTATYGDEESSLTLSGERAEAIRQLMIEKGFDGKIKCYGAGYSVPEVFCGLADDNETLLDYEPDYQTDESGQPVFDADGNYILNDKAQSHRVVIGFLPEDARVAYAKVKGIEIPG